jgi:predicted nucleotidyltransferase
MSPRTAVTIGFSVPPQVKAEFEQMAQEERRTKSELFREMVRVRQRTRGLTASEERAAYAAASRNTTAVASRPVEGAQSPPKIDFDGRALAAFCRRWEIRELALFGSALRDDFQPDSDVDVLVTFSAGTRPKLSDWPTMEEALQGILGGRKVDLVERRAVEESENHIRRRNILKGAKVIYVA